MTGIYYTTSDIKQIFCFKSDTALTAKINDGFLPEPDLRGRPNKWLRVRIDAIVEELNDYEKSEG